MFYLRGSLGSGRRLHVRTVGMDPLKWASPARLATKAVPCERGGCHALMQYVDDVVEAIFQRLCIREQDDASDRSMNLSELRLALGLSEPLVNEALLVLTFLGGQAAHVSDAGPCGPRPGLATTVRGVGSDVKKAQGRIACSCGY